MQYLKIASYIILFLFYGCGDLSPKESDLQYILESSYSKFPNAIGILVHVEAPEQSISWSGAIGYANWERTDSIKADQPALIASMTKNYVAVAILRLIEQGHVKLDDGLQGLLSEKTSHLMLQNGFDLKTITLAHLLSHKSGIPGHVGTSMFQDKLKNDPMYRWTRDEQIALALTQGPRNPPGTSFHYTDTNYLLATEILEQKTGLPYYQAINQLINYQKFGLNATWFYSLEPTPESVKPLIHQYVPKNDEHSYAIDNSVDLYGGGGIAATTKDVAQYTQHVFNGTVFDKSETLDLMFTDIKVSEGDANEDYINGVPCQYFLGVQECDFDGLKAYWHHGYWGTIFKYFPELNASIVLFVVNEDEFANVERDFMNQLTNILK